MQEEIQQLRIRYHPLENIHEFVIKKAKEMLEKRSDLNNTEIAYELGALNIEWPTNA